MADVAEVSAPKPVKPRLVENFYVDQKGEKASRPQPDVVAVGKTFLETKHTEVLKLADLKQEQLLQAAAFGLQQVGQNAYGAAADEEERIEALQKRWETILGGRWAGEGRESGPRTTDLIEAWKAAWKDRSGRDRTEEEIAQFVEALEDEEFRKATAANKLIDAKVKAIRAQRAAERAAKALAEAGNDDQELPTG